MIKYIIVHRTSKYTINGWPYRMAEVISTKTGNRVYFQTPHESNTRQAVLKVLETSLCEVEEIEIQDIPIREFKRLMKILQPVYDYQMNDTIAKLK